MSDLKVIFSPSINFISQGLLQCRYGIVFFFFTPFGIYNDDFTFSAISRVWVFDSNFVVDIIRGYIYPCKYKFIPSRQYCLSINIRVKSGLDPN